MVTRHGFPTLLFCSPDRFPCVWIRLYKMQNASYLKTCPYIKIELFAKFYLNYNHVIGVSIKKNAHTWYTFALFMNFPQTVLAMFDNLVILTIEWNKLFTCSHCEICVWTWSQHTMCAKGHRFLSYLPTYQRGWKISSHQNILLLSWRPWTAVELCSRSQYGWRNSPGKINQDVLL